MRRAIIQVSLLLLTSVIWLAPASPARAAAPDLTGFHAYSGSYVRGGSAQGFGFEVERQVGRRLEKVSIDASNESQLRGSGTISKDRLKFHVNARTPGPK